jgi:hypothetical protein
VKAKTRFFISKNAGAVVRKTVAINHAKAFRFKPIFTLGKRKKLIVHVGTSELLPGTKLGITARKNEVHLVYEPQVWPEKFKAKNPSIQIVRKKFEETKLAPESVDRLFMHNVLTAHEVEKTRILGTIALVLRKGGQAFLAHTWTPEEFPFHVLSHYAEKMGLKAELIARDEFRNGSPSPEQMKILRKIMGNPKVIQTGFYIARLTKQ